MNKRRSSSLPYAPHWGALEIAGLYLIIGALWILFSDRIAARVALNSEMLATISLYKGWIYVLITALLLYGLIRRHTAALRASEVQLRRVIDAMPFFISYVGTDRRYRFTNRTYQEWYYEETEGKHIEEVIGTAAYKVVSKYIDKVLAGETVSYETGVPYQGTELFMAVQYVPDRAADGLVNGFFVMAQDRTSQRQAEEELRLWADAFEGCAHGIAIADPNTNRVVVCNPAFAKMHRCRVEEIVGSAILSLYAPLDHEHVRRNFQKADQIGHAHFETKMIRKGGSTCPVEVDVVSVLGEDGEVLHRVVTAQDISERKQAEEVLQASEERYRIVSELTSDYAYKDRIEADGSIVPEWITDSFVRITGYTLEEARAPGFWQRLAYPEDIPILVTHVERLLSGQPHTMELRVITKPGEIRWLRDYANPIWDTNQNRVINLFGAVQDITEYKQAEEKLQLQARWLEQINDAVITSDQNYVITAWNPGAERVYGWRAEEVIGKKGEEVLRSEFFGQTRAEVLQELNEHGEFSAEIMQLRKDGSRIYVETRTVIVRDESGQAIGYISVNRDITERKQVEQENASLARFPAENPNPVLRATHEGKIIYANAASEPLLRDWHATVGDYLPTDWIQRIKALIQTGTGKNIDVPCGEKTYAIIFVYAPDANDVNIYGRDITESKQAEEQLRKSEEQYRYLFENNPHPMWVYDRKTLAFLNVNEAAIEKYGYSRQEFLNMTLADIRPPEEMERLMNNLAQPRRPLERSDGWRHRLKDGTIIHVEITSHTVEIDGHESALVVAEDVTERVQAQNTIRHKDALLRLTSEMAKVGGWEFDPETGNGTWTDEVARIHDLDPSQETSVALGFSFYTGVSRVKVEQAVKEAIELAKPYDLELEMTSAKGSHKWVRTAALPIVNNGKVTKVQGIFQDITERKQAEEALRMSTQRLKRAQEIAHLGSWELDLVHNELTWSDEVYRIFGLEPQEFGATYEAFLEAVHPEDRGAVDAAYSGSIQAGKDSYEIEHRVVRQSSGEIRIVHEKCEHFRNADGQIIRSVGMVHDITERKQIEQALQAAHDDLEIKVQERTAALSEANALLQALMENMPDHIYFKDTQSRFIRNSRSQASLLGLNNPSEAIGKTDFDFFPHAAKSFAEEQEVMRTGKPLVDFEEWVVWPDGRETWVSTTKLPLRNSEGQTIGIFGISRDITERKRAEQAIRQLNADLAKQTEQLQASNKELEAFSYSVSHDLRAPLRAIDGYTRILVEDYESILDDEGKRVCGVISREARRMGQLIDDLLSFSRLGRKEMYASKIEMRTLVVSILNEVLKEEERERFDIHIANLPPVRGDSSLIRQVWVNLLANAIKFTSKKERAVIEVGSKTTKDEFIYYVRDNGAGFEMEYVNKLFGVFQRLHTESEFSGTGVGLAIVQRIVRRHNGRVWAEGEVEKGATFYFALPRKEKLS